MPERIDGASASDDMGAPEDFPTKRTKESAMLKQSRSRRSRGATRAPPTTLTFSGGPHTGIDM